VPLPWAVARLHQTNPQGTPHVDEWVVPAKAVAARLACSLHVPRDVRDVDDESPKPAPDLILPEKGTEVLLGEVAAPVAGALGPADETYTDGSSVPPNRRLKRASNRCAFAGYRSGAGLGFFGIFSGLQTNNKADALAIAGSLQTTPADVD
jgi:hypothetical protein